MNEAGNVSYADQCERIFGVRVKINVTTNIPAEEKIIIKLSGVPNPEMEICNMRF